MAGQDAKAQLGSNRLQYGATILIFMKNGLLT